MDAIQYEATFPELSSEWSIIACYLQSPNSVTPLSSSPAAPVLKDRKQKVADKLWIGEYCSHTEYSDRSLTSFYLAYGIPPSEGEVESIESPLWSHIHTGLPVDMEDPCASSLQLLRALYGLNK